MASEVEQELRDLMAKKNEMEQEILLHRQILESVRISTVTITLLCDNNALLILSLNRTRPLI